MILKSSKHFSGPKFAPPRTFKLLYARLRTWGIVWLWLRNDRNSVSMILNLNFLISSFTFINSFFYYDNLDFLNSIFESKKLPKLNNPKLFWHQNLLLAILCRWKESDEEMDTSSSHLSNGFLFSDTCMLLFNDYFIMILVLNFKLGWTTISYGLVWPCKSKLGQSHDRQFGFHH